MPSPSAVIPASLFPPPPYPSFPRRRESKARRQGTSDTTLTPHYALPIPPSSPRPYLRPHPTRHSRRGGNPRPRGEEWPRRPATAPHPTRHSRGGGNPRPRGEEWPRRPATAPHPTRHSRGGGNPRPRGEEWPRRPATAPPYPSFPRKRESVAKRRGAPDTTPKPHYAFPVPPSLSSPPPYPSFPRRRESKARRQGTSDTTPKPHYAFPVPPSLPSPPPYPSFPRKRESTAKRRGAPDTTPKPHYAFPIPPVPITAPPYPSFPRKRESVAWRQGVVPPPCHHPIPIRHSRFSGNPRPGGGGTPHETSLIPLALQKPIRRDFPPQPLGPRRLVHPARY